MLTLGVRGTLSCLDAASGKVLWRNKETEGTVPRFATSSSPIVVDGIVIAQLGRERGGSILGLDLATGDQKWKWTEDGPAYGSPVLVSIDGMKAILAPTDKNMVALAASDGKVLWKIMYTQGRYNAASPIVDGDKLVYAGPTKGITAEKLAKDGDELKSENVWSNGDNSLMFNTPVLKDGLLFGISNLNSLFCVDASDGKTVWNCAAGESSHGRRSPAVRRPTTSRRRAATRWRAARR